jgi:Legionella pneumophila major outer membrane protein precursor
MKLHTLVALAATLFAAAAATTREARAQGRVYNVRQERGAAPAQRMNENQLPMGQAPTGRPPVEIQSSNGYADGYAEEFPSAGYPVSGGWDEGCGPGESGPGYGYDDGCCDTCGGNGCGGECWNRGGLSSNLFGLVCPPGRYFFTADYLHVRSNFSEAVAFLVQDDSQQGIATDTFHELDFQYESSYRLGGGYRLCNCGEEVRFYHTRLSSFADDIAPDGALIPFEVTPTPGGETSIHADVDVKSYDLEFAKTIPLGGPLGSECGDACGECGDACASDCGCPAWDVTWSGGLRFADVDWNRTYTATSANGFDETEAISAMDFRGGGVKLGLEGRRYFCGNGCLSVYLKGDLSLLLGDVDLITTRRVDDPSTPNNNADNLITQTISSRQVIPVTEIEAGLTGHITCNTSITTGYLFSAWHDLGFRDEFRGFTNPGATFLETGYDDANLLGFDGFFARMEVAY